jgi:uncharacterized membrane protein
MQTSLASVLEAGLAPALLLGMAFLVANRARMLFAAHGVGILGGAAGVAALLAGAGREETDALFETVILAFSLSLIASCFFRSEPGRVRRMIVPGFVCAVAAEFAYRIFLLPRAHYQQASRFLTTDLLLVAFGAVVGIVLMGILAWIVAFSGRRVLATPHAFLATAAALLSLEPAVQIARFLFVSGRLPLTNAAMTIMFPLINHMEIFAWFPLVPILIYFVGVFRLAAVTNPAAAFPHAAAARMHRAQSLAIRRGAFAGIALVLLSGVTLAANHVAANREIMIADPQPVAADGGRIRIALDSVSEGDLHRFVATTPEGTNVRFLVLHKGSGIYGVGLDACQICGAAGYYQDADEVICKNCQSRMNVATIGFPGGCNPIPLEFTTDATNLTIEVSDLSKHAGIF